MSTLSLAILGLISQRPLTGYDLRKVFATTPMGHFSSSPGAIYPALRMPLPKFPEQADELFIRLLLCPRQATTEE